MSSAALTLLLVLLIAAELTIIVCCLGNLAGGQLTPDALGDACEAKGQPYQMRLQVRERAAVHPLGFIFALQYSRVRLRGFGYSARALQVSKELLAFDLATKGPPKALQGAASNGTARVDGGTYFEGFLDQIAFQFDGNFERGAATCRDQRARSTFKISLPTSRCFISCQRN